MRSAVSALARVPLRWYKVMMHPKIHALQNRWYPSRTHPYTKLEERLRSYLGPDTVVLDAGCGKEAPLLRNLAPFARRAIGIDLTSTQEILGGIELISADLKAIPLPDGSVDLIFSRSVLEHLEQPRQVFSEFARVLRAGGHVICLTPNKWDYASLIAMAIPNRWHPAIVSVTEGRAPSDVFPTYYRANTK